MSGEKVPAAKGGLGGWLDVFGRRHPRLTVAAVVVLAVVVTIVLLYRDEGPGVLYEGF